jgi:hypothetical protein
MLDTLRRILSLIEDINSRASISAITQKEIDEEKANIEEFAEVLNSTSQLVDDIRMKLETSGSDVSDSMVYLQLKLSDIIWHIEQVHNLLKKTINPDGYETKT